MPKVRYLRVGFSQRIRVEEIPQFRAAIIEKTNRAASLFHNHQSDTAVIYRYPLIQYKIVNDKASLVCLEAGTDDIHHLLQHRDLDLRIGHRQKSFEIEAVNLCYHQITQTATSLDYRLNHWLPFNQHNYQRWLNLRHDKVAEKQLLEKLLCGNILSFAKGINWRILNEVKVKIYRIRHRQLLSFKRQDMMSLSVDFSVNVDLPDYVGLGKGVSVGFGVLRSLKTSKN